jgi:transposase-like protein
MLFDKKHQGGRYHVKEVKEALAVRRKLLILEYAREVGNVAKLCRSFGVLRSVFYTWKKRFDAGGGVDFF